MINEKKGAKSALFLHSLFKVEYGFKKLFGAQKLEKNKCRTIIESTKNSFVGLKYE